MDGISALMDGELEAQDAQRQLARLKDDAELRDRWDTFHVIGDALRGERALLSPQFTETLAKRLAEEPTILAPRRTISSPKRATTYALSAAASLSAAALVAWVAVSPTVPLTPTANIAPAPGSVLPVSAPAALASVPSEGRMNEYLLAHQGFSPSTALQGLAPYIRSVSATRPVDGR
jgi:sigma-E factor negative regulatory protein RseA